MYEHLWAILSWDFLHALGKGHISAIFTFPSYGCCTILYAVRQVRETQVVNKYNRVIETKYSATHPFLYECITQACILFRPN